MNGAAVRESGGVQAIAKQAAHTLDSELVPNLGGALGLLSRVWPR